MEGLPSSVPVGRGVRSSEWAAPLEPAPQEKPAADKCSNSSSLAWHSDMRVSPSDTMGHLQQVKQAQEPAANFALWAVSPTSENVSYFSPVVCLWSSSSSPDACVLISSVSAMSPQDFVLLGPILESWVHAIKELASGITKPLHTTVRK